MGYKNSYERQKELSFDYFENIVREIEELYSEGICSQIKDKYIYVLLPGIFEQSVFMKTTVSDVKNVCKKINITCLMAKVAGGKYYYHELFNIREASAKTFRGFLRYTPPNTLAYTSYGITKDHVKFCGSTPILQDEIFINAFCDNAYERNEIDTDYDYALTHAFNLLALDKRYAIKKNAYKECNEQAQKRFLDISRTAQYIISIYYELDNSWGVTYKWNDKTFIFPMERKFFKKLFRDREKVEGRRRVLPTVVKEHETKKGIVSSHLRDGNYPCRINGRQFGFLIGGEDFEQIFPENNYGRKKRNELMESINRDILARTVG